MNIFDLLLDLWQFFGGPNREDLSIVGKSPMERSKARFWNFAKWAFIVAVIALGLFLYFSK